MHQQEYPGYFTRYSEADYSVYDRVIGVRLPRGAKDSFPLQNIYTTPGARVGSPFLRRKSAAS
jgi:hypothetical protein